MTNALEIWRSAVGQGGDHIGPVIDMLGEEGMERAMVMYYKRLKERFQAWGPAQYVKGFPASEVVKMKVLTVFDGKDLGVFVSDPVNYHGPHYTWTPRKGFNYFEEGILRYLIHQIIGTRRAATVVVRQGDSDALMCAITLFEGRERFTRVIRIVKDGPLFDYRRMQTKVNEVLRYDW